MISYWKKNLKLHQNTNKNNKNLSKVTKEFSCRRHGQSTKHFHTLTMKGKLRKKISLIIVMKTSNKYIPINFIK